MDEVPPAPPPAARNDALAHSALQFDVMPNTVNCRIISPAAINLSVMEEFCQSGQLFYA